MNIRNVITLALILAFMTAACGCGRLETYGEKISNRNITPIKEIVMHPEQYTGKTVTVKGKIALECDTGCWFHLEEDKAMLYTDLQPYGFAIPQKVGRTATIEGNISIEDGKPILAGKAVEIQ